MGLTLGMEGVHPTTVSCLEALQAMAGTHRFGRVLDMGCGGGVLSVMAVHWWGGDVVAADIAPEAVADARALVAGQGMEDNVTVVRSDGFTDAAIGAGGPYDLIIFNLLAETITQMAPEVKAHLAPGGVCMLSGILSWLEPGVVLAYEAMGFSQTARVSREPWQTLVFTASSTETTG